MAFSVVSCDNGNQQAAWWQGENERVGLAQDLELKKFRFDQTYSSDVVGHEKLIAKNRVQATQLAELVRLRANMESEVSALEDSWTEFRQATLASHRMAASGATFETLTLASGRKFEEVKVTAIDDAGVTIRHADGSARLRFSDLRADQQERFGLEPDLAMAAEAQERQQAAEYEQWLEKEMVAVNAQKSKELELSISASREQERKADSDRALAANRNLIAANSRPLGQPSKSFGGGGRSYRGSTRYYSTYYYRPYYYQNLCYPRRIVYGANPRAGRINYPTRAPRVNYASPTVVKRRASFAGTTINSIP